MKILSSKVSGSKPKFRSRLSLTQYDSHKLTNERQRYGTIIVVS